MQEDWNNHTDKHTTPQAKTQACARTYTHTYMYTPHTHIHHTHALTFTSQEEAARKQYKVKTTPGVSTDSEISRTRGRTKMQMSPETTACYTKHQGYEETVAPACHQNTKVTKKR